MSIPPPVPPSRRPRRRRWFLIAGLSLLIPTQLVAFLPWLLNTQAGNRFTERRLTRAFAPGRVRIGAIRLSWIGPARLTGVALDAPTGKTVVTAPAASLSASLWGLITHPDRPGTLALEGAAFEVERQADGSIDLAEALEGVFAGRDPLRNLTIQADRASVRFRDPMLAQPIMAESMDLLVELRPSPATDTWSIDLRQAAGPTLRIRGEVDRWQTRPSSRGVPDLDLEVSLRHWPIAAKAEGLDVSAGVDGDFSAHRTEGRWRSGGTLHAAEFKAAGQPLKGDQLALANLAAEWSIARGPDGWSIDRLEATSPLGRLSAVVPDLADFSRAAQIEGHVDLAAVARQLPGLFGLVEGASVESGTARLVASSKSGGDRSEWSVDAKLADLAWKDRGGAHRPEGTPLSLLGRATYRPEGHRLDVAELALTTRYGSIRAYGTLDGLNGPLNLDISGTLAPDWDALTTLLADRLEPGAKVSGRPSPFHLKGQLHDVRGAEGLQAVLGVELREADLFGMRLGPSSIMARARDGRLTIDPIETKLNGGRLHLEPVVELDAAGGPRIRLGKSSTLTGAAVNEEVSHRVLSYVAPVLDRTTRSSGRVSVSIDEASFSFGGDPGRRANVTGEVVFQDVEFAPSPLAREVMAIVAPRKEPESLRLDQPVRLSIADGRVNQRGLAIPIGDVTRIEIDGWVDFDKNLGLVVTLPVTGAMFSNNPLLGEIVSGTKVRVPIRGTLAAPKLDKAEFNAALKDLGKTLLVRGAGVGALELLDRMARPRDPNATPPPTPEERKARRLEKRNERRRARGLEPLPGPNDPP